MRAFQYIINGQKSNGPINIALDEVDSIYINTKYITKRNLERSKIKDLLKQNHPVVFYNGYIMINNMVFNGWTGQMIDEILHEIFPVKEKEIVVEFEEDTK